MKRKTAEVQRFLREFVKAEIATAHQENPGQALPESAFCKAGAGILLCAGECDSSSTGHDAERLFRDLPQVPKGQEPEFRSERIVFPRPDLACLCVEISLDPLLFTLSMTLLADEGRQGGWRALSAHLAPAAPCPALPGGQKSGKQAGQETGKETVQDEQDTLAGLHTELQTEALGLIARSIAGGILGVYAQNDRYPLYFINEGMLSYVGFTREDFIETYGDDVLRLIHPDDREPVRAILEEGLRTKKEYECRFRVLKKDGGFLWMFNRGRRSRSQGQREVLMGVFVDITALVQTQQELSEQARALSVSREQFRLAFRSTNRYMAVYDVPTRTLTQPPETAALFRRPEVISNLPDSVLNDPFLLPEARDAYRRFYDAMNNGVPEGEGCFHLLDKDGDYRWFLARYTLIFGDDGAPLRSVIAYEDITERREKELAYEKWLQYFQLQRPECVDYFECNLSHDLISGSRYAPRITHDGREDSSREQSFSAAVRYFAEHLVYPPDRAAYEAFYHLDRLRSSYSSGNAEETLEYRRMRGDTPFWVKSTATMIPDPDTGDIKAFFLIRDIDEEKCEKLSIQERVERDPLTGLLNRAAIVEKAQSLLSSGGSHLFAILDIDYFKNLNDTFGHQFGDLVLKDIAATMRGFIRENDLCGRLGGDEFIIMLSGIPTRVVAERALQRLCTLLKKDYDTGASISTSVGAVYPCLDSAFESLYAKADLALYRAKGQGRNQYVLATAEGTLPPKNMRH